MEILGVDVIQLESISEVTRFRNIILPDECFWREDDGARFFTGEYVALVDKIRSYGKEYFKEITDKKIYFS